MKYYRIFLICVLVSGCAALLTEQKYIRIDAPVAVTQTRAGVIYSIPEKKFVRKIRIFGEGKIQDIEIWVRGEMDDWKPVKDVTRHEEYNWKPLKKIKGKLVFPVEVKIPMALTAHTDAVRILQRTRTVVLSQRGYNRSNTGQRDAYAAEANETSRTRYRSRNGEINTVEFYTITSENQ